MISKYKLRKNLSKVKANKCVLEPIKKVLNKYQHKLNQYNLKKFRFRHNFSKLLTKNNVRIERQSLISQEHRKHNQHQLKQ